MVKNSEIWKQLSMKFTTLKVDKLQKRTTQYCIDLLSYQLTMQNNPVEFSLSFCHIGGHGIGHCHRRPFKLRRRCCYAVVPHSSRASLPTCLLACLHSSPDSLPAGSARAPYPSRPVACELRFVPYPPDRNPRMPLRPLPLSSSSFICFKLPSLLTH